jgi:hypothetical protein
LHNSVVGHELGDVLVGTDIGGDKWPPWLMWVISARTEFSPTCRFYRIDSTPVGMCDI